MVIVKQKAPLKQKMRAGLHVFIAMEISLVATAYIYWRKMNNSQKYRYSVYKNGSPFLLNAYYWTGEKLGGLNTREMDYKAWGIITDEEKE